MITRKLYGGTEDTCVARCTLEPDDIGASGTASAALRMYDVIGGDALVFLTPAKVRQLIADLTPFAAPARKAKPRRKR